MNGASNRGSVIVGHAPSVLSGASTIKPRYLQGVPSSPSSLPANAETTERCQKKKKETHLRTVMRCGGRRYSLARTRGYPLPSLPARTPTDILCPRTFIPRLTGRQIDRQADR
jgi:hypothetical protein